MTDSSSVPVSPVVVSDAERGRVHRTVAWAAVAVFACAGGVVAVGLVYELAAFYPWVILLAFAVMVTDVVLVVRAISRNPVVWKEVVGIELKRWPADAVVESKPDNG